MVLAARVGAAAVGQAGCVAGHGWQWRGGGGERTAWTTQVVRLRRERLLDWTSSPYVATFFAYQFALLFVGATFTERIFGEEADVLEAVRPMQARVAALPGPARDVLELDGPGRGVPGRWRSSPRPGRVQALPVKAVRGGSRWSGGRSR